MKTNVFTIVTNYINIIMAYFNIGFFDSLHFVKGAREEYNFVFSI